MYSIGKLSKEFSLSRSTLLYYDSIGLLSPSKRSDANYREYSEEDRSRLKQICDFREAGVPLELIKKALDSEGNVKENYVLEQRLIDLNQEIRYLRFQQKLIVEMLTNKGLEKSHTLFNRNTFVSLLKAAGLDTKLMASLHKQFEKDMPDSHQAFLEFLGLSEEEIKVIRQQSN